jgi:hypothetical protein
MAKMLGKLRVRLKKLENKEPDASPLAQLLAYIDGKTAGLPSEDKMHISDNFNVLYNR